MLLCCPNCGNQRIRSSRLRSVAEYLGTFFGFYPLRCPNCRLRFRERVWRFSDVRFARCPRCFRLELSAWQTSYYTPPFRTKLLLQLGARPLRCDVCRCNFAGFRPVKESYSREISRAARLAKE
jgi:hypothetical protein